mgnify:CR=1 FL=1
MEKKKVDVGAVIDSANYFWVPFGITIMMIIIMATDGYDLFLNPQPGLMPTTSSPVPADYVVGPDDVIEVQLYGNQNYTVDLTVNRDGHINLPMLGAVNVGGQRYSAVKRDIEDVLTTSRLEAAGL